MSVISQFTFLADATFHSNTADLDRQIQQLKQCQTISEDEVRALCAKTIELLMREANIVPLNAPVTICGDIHGQFYDLLELFQEGGECPDVQYLFMGDYVDRGNYSVETLLLLLALKVRYPDRITLLRGNHESRQVTQTYGFYDECIRKYGNSNVWRYCTEVFDYLTISAMIEDEVFCVHGGLSPEIEYLHQINSIDRQCEVPHSGPMCDLLWSDPDDQIADWRTSPRGAGFLFGSNVVDKFCHNNNISLIARAHQLINEGYRYMFDKRLVTVWSAPNYCYRCGNIAAILELNEIGECHFRTFYAAPQDQRGNGGPSVGSANAMSSSRTLPVDYFL